MGLGIFDNSKQNTDQNEDNWLIIEPLTKKYAPTNWPLNYLNPFKQTVRLKYRLYSER
jgi:hypothetical protein